jgi:hypothetical protein
MSLRVIPKQTTKFRMCPQRSIQPSGRSVVQTRPIGGHAIADAEGPLGVPAEEVETLPRTRGGGPRSSYDPASPVLAA